ncbi:mitochondrial transmembrane protein 53-like protein [Andalucia godoyi]|uniref:Mitochondrial transmembrane protein 53-like protein n=1 Tax=Andalucia godoyi TaxID=505711 RepID=A0A8K0AJL6_ANDGO|nr:mitochondrial transmembrane protein 53-like protein [Andalucia godoyi]|eukprot:ANDGO_02121.mRNA.1 mitochondrial transmembrane protein 53-like protein
MKSGLSSGELNQGDIQDVALSAKERIYFRRSKTVDPSKPIVVLVGFLGCPSRVLRKFIELYHGQGHDVVYLVPTATALFHYRRGTQVAETLLGILKQVFDKDSSFVMALYSNNGSMVYYNMLRVMEKRPQLKISISGVIFDGSPGKLVPSRAIAAMRISMGLNFLTTMIIRVVFFLWMSVICPLFLPSEVKARNEYWEAMSTPAFHNTVFLYLYTTRDSLVDAVWVQEALEKVSSHRDRSPIVMSKRFEDSNHCSLLRDHPEEYKQLVLSFFAAIAETKTKTKISQAILQSKF